MALLFFSGGIDSTVLAFDMAKSPHRYGLVEGAEELILFTFGDPKKSARLGALVSSIENISKLPIQWVARRCPLLADKPLPVLPGGMKSMTPSVGVYDHDRRTMPYTPGLMVWLASEAINALSGEDYQQAFFGFQCEPPEWAEHDAGLEKPNDTSIHFIEALNHLVRASGESTRFRAPLMENRLDRYHIVRTGEDIGVPWKMTSSCVAGWKKDCGRCGQCIKRVTAFNAVGIK